MTSAACRRPVPARALKRTRDGADVVGVTVPSTSAARARRRHRQIQLEHALRASAAQQLRVIAAARRIDVYGRRALSDEQAIAAWIEAILADRRQAAQAPGADRARPDRDELAARRGRRGGAARSA